MATRKVQEDGAARLAAIDAVDDAIKGNPIQDTSRDDDRQEVAAGIVGAFPYVETETATARVAGETVTMARLVLTGQWVVQK